MPGLVLELFPQLVDLVPAQRPADGHDVVDLVEQLVDPGPGQPHGPRRLPDTGDGGGDSEPILRQAGDLLGGVGADLFQQGADEVVEDFARVGHARGLQGLADPLLHAVDPAGDDPHDEVFLDAHVGRQEVQAMKDFEDGADAFLAVGLHQPDFAQGVVGVELQGHVPNDAGHVLQTVGEAAQLFVAQSVLEHAGPPLAPEDLGDGGRD